MMRWTWVSTAMVGIAKALFNTILAVFSPTPLMLSSSLLVLGTVESNLSITLNEAKILEDEAWDGLKGIITNNTTLSNEELIHQYSNLWQVEESFRITKHDLKIRPIYHWKPNRVKAHLAISFMAYTLVRYLEHRVRLQYIKLSPEKIRQILLSVQTSIYYNTKTNNKYSMPSLMSKDAKKIYKLMEVPVIQRAIKL